MNEPQQPGMWRRHGVWWGIALALSAGAVWLSLRHANWEGLARSLGQARLSLLIAALATVVATTAAKAARWHLLLRQSGTRLSLIRVARLLLIGQLGNALLPGRLGDASRVVLSGRHAQGGAAAALGTVLVEKALDGGMGILLLILLALRAPLPPWLRGPAVTLGLLLEVVLVLLIFVAMQRRWAASALECATSWLPAAPRVALSRLTSALGAGLRSLSQPRGTLVALAWSILIWALAASTNLITLSALGIAAPAWVTWLILTAIYSSASLPTVPAQLGVFEYACILALAPAGVGGEPALAFGLSLHLLVLLPPAVLGSIGAAVEGLSLSRLRSAARSMLPPARLSALVVLVFLMLGTVGPATAGELDDLRPWPRMCPESNRFGVSVAGSARVLHYDVGLLHAGWYHSFTHWYAPPEPAGMGYVQTIRLSDDGPFPDLDKACTDCPTWTELRYIALASPGSLWLIGNEPDRPKYQDDITPPGYARLYHDFYEFLKQQDPTCRVAIGGVVQPTPLRLQYLDLILQAYRDTYGEPMPVDVWNTHNYVLREKRDYDGCPDCWGADIPPGIPDDTGILYEIADHDNLNYWVSHLVNLRIWMADRGYQDRPLILSEYGILYPEELGFDYPRVRDFMVATFDWLMTAAHPAIGYPADDNRLVQAWAWWSLDQDKFEDLPIHMRSNLFVPYDSDDPNAGQPTALGLDFAAYTESILHPATDVAIVGLDHSVAVENPYGKLTFTATAHLTNYGTETAVSVPVRFERDAAPAGEVTIPSISPGEVQTTAITWDDLSFGQVLHVKVTADPGGQLADCNQLNNVSEADWLVAPNRVFLPIAGSPGGK